jgi:DNA-binding transcriptional MocR family regulator
MIAAINEFLVPLGVGVPQTDRDVVGGYFIWLTLPNGLKGNVVAQRAKEDENVVVSSQSPSTRCGTTSLVTRFGESGNILAR